MHKNRVLTVVLVTLFFTCPIISIFGQSSLLMSDYRLGDFYVEKLQITASRNQLEIKQVKGQAYQFAVPFQVQYPIQNPAIDSTIKGYFHYLIQIDVASAYAINFTLRGLRKSGVVVTRMYNCSTNELIGSFYPTRNKFDLTPFPIILDSSVMVEIVSKRLLKSGDVDVYRVGGTYDKQLLNSSESCEVDVACPQGELYSDIKKSVVRLLIDNTWLCTGTMLNNTLENRRPFLLTANHCIDNEMLAANTAFYFNYESPYCEAPHSSYSSANEFFLSGSSLLATKNDDEGALDFALLEIAEEIPENFDVVFAGWSASDVAPNYSIAIHHPAGDVKKISFDYHPAQNSTYSYEYDANSHWRILKWDLGVTEGGSSGSALFNRNKQVVGDLTGGEASCDYPYNDFYTKFSDAFNKYSDSSQQLKYWLDPLALGAYAWESLPRTEIYDKPNSVVYPNPSDGYLFVYDLPLGEDCSISLFGVDGKIVWTSRIVPTYAQTKIDYPNELSGLYILKIESNSFNKEVLVVLR